MTEELAPTAETFHATILPENCIYGGLGHHQALTSWKVSGTGGCQGTAGWSRRSIQEFPRSALPLQFCTAVANTGFASYFTREEHRSFCWLTLLAVVINCLLK